MTRKPKDLRQVARYLTAAICGMALSGFIQLLFAWTKPGALAEPEWLVQQVVFLLLVFTTVIVGGIDQSRRKKQGQVHHDHVG
jgi:hypothetical protein